nr:hypothetical protein DVH24_023985 [Ipomoea trifida]
MPAEKNQLSLSDIFMIQPKKKLPEEEEEEGEEDDTLSLSDLPAYCNAAEWDQYSGESESQSSSGTSFTSLSSSSSSAAVEGEGDGGFEFFSEEWKKNAVSNPPDNIIFCGKLISSKKQQPSPKNAARISEKKIEHGGGGNRFLRIFRAKIFGASRKGASTEKKSDESSSSSAAKVKKDYYCCYSSSAKNDDVRSLSVMRSPPLSSSPSGKSRWLLVFFGFSRASMEAMELRDIRNRRSRKMTSSSSTRTEDGDVESAIVSGGDGARRRLWRLIRALSCGGSHHSLIRSVGVDGLGFSPGM